MLTLPDSIFWTNLVLHNAQLQIRLKSLNIFAQLLLIVTSMITIISAFFLIGIWIFEQWPSAMPSRGRWGQERTRQARKTRQKGNKKSGGGEGRRRERKSQHPLWCWGQRALLASSNLTHHDGFHLNWLPYLDYHTRTTILGLPYADKYIHFSHL